MVPWQIARMVLVIVLMAWMAACGPGATPSPSPSPVPTHRATLTPTASPSGLRTVTPTSTRLPSPVRSATPTGIAYAVERGDTLSSIAAKFKVTLAALRAANPQVTDPTKLQIGQVLTIPPG